MIGVDDTIGETDEDAEELLFGSLDVPPVNLETSLKNYVISKIQSPPSKQTIDKKGWLHTCDISFVDNDDEIFIIDRLKENIKYKGFQVAPAAVTSMQDELAGEVPVAYVVTSMRTDEKGLHKRVNTLSYKMEWSILILHGCSGCVRPGSLLLHLVLIKKDLFEVLERCQKVDT